MSASERRQVVIDTSVVFKWFSPGEDGADAASRLLDDHVAGEISLVAPASLPLELANALRYSSVAGDDVLEVVGTFHLAHVELVEMSSALLAEATRLAYEHGLSVYDAVFFALASERRCVLATSDRKAFGRRVGGVEVLLV